MTRKLYILILLLIPGFYLGQVEDADRANAKTKSIYLYQFAKGIDWPSEAKTGDFVIGVLGDEAIYNQMKSSYAGKPIGSQTITVKFFKAASEVSNCHILYISRSNSNDLTALANKTELSKTLFVTNNNSSLNSGAVINFIAAETIKFELSKTNAGKKSLTIGDQLIKYAANVY